MLFMDDKYKSVCFLSLLLLFSFAIYISLLRCLVVSCGGYGAQWLVHSPLVLGARVRSSASVDKFSVSKHAPLASFTG